MRKSLSSILLAASALLVITGCGQSVKKAPLFDNARPAAPCVVSQDNSEILVRDYFPALTTQDKVSANLTAESPFLTLLDINCDGQKGTIVVFNSLPAKCEGIDPLQAPFLSYEENPDDPKSFFINIDGGATEMAVLWQNTVLDKSNCIEPVDSTRLKVTIPSNAKKMRRSFIRAFAANENGIGNELFIPLANGVVTFDVTSVKHPAWMRDAVLCDFDPETMDIEVLKAAGVDVLVLSETFLEGEGADALIASLREAGFKVVMTMVPSAASSEELLAGLRALVDRGADGIDVVGAAALPATVWESAAEALRAENPEILLLSEDESGDLQRNAFDAFDMASQVGAWEKAAAGELSAEGLGDFYVDFILNAGIPAGTVPVNYLSAALQSGADSKVFKQFATLSFTVPGAPVVNFDTADSDIADYIRELIEMRDSHSCLWAHPWGGLMAILPTSEPQKVFAFEREAEGDLCLAMFNFSAEEVTYKVDNHLVTTDSEFTLPPYGCHIIFSVGDCFGDCDETETEN